MYRKLAQRLRLLMDAAPSELLQNNRIGLEKESLRVDSHGGISQKPHPVRLGSALTHPYITTDYSEALLECVTPALTKPKDTLQFLADSHQYIYHQLDNELLWATSMPCVLAGEKNIPIANYGPSNPGRMKHVYRRGLGYRYGRVMQVIAGVHFNFSFADAFWPLYQHCENESGDLGAFKDHHYFALIRNLQRFGWIVPYLFGASPAVCKSFLGDHQPTQMQALNPSTYYEPYATSLRMGDIGYQNNQESKTGVKISYDALQPYIQSLQYAIKTPYPAYQRIGVVVDGDYRQLNSNILQIENEYYSSVRPKQPPQENEMPTLALGRRGVLYVELRSLDVNAFHPLGIEEKQLHFLESFFLFCLLHHSPPISEQEHLEIDQNLSLTAHKGRQPGLQLRRHGENISLQAWAEEICQEMQGPCAWLDQKNDQNAVYSQALQQQWAAVKDPEKTPSARMLATLSDHQEGFFEFAQQMSLQHQKTFQQLPIAQEKFQYFDTLSRTSLQQQKQLEEAKQVSFGDFLRDYFEQQLTP